MFCPILYNSLLFPFRHLSRGVQTQSIQIPPLHNTGYARLHPRTGNLAFLPQLYPFSACFLRLVFWKHLSSPAGDAGVNSQAGSVPSIKAGSRQTCLPHSTLIFPDLSNAGKLSRLAITGPCHAHETLDWPRRQARSCLGSLECSEIILLPTFHKVFPTPSLWSSWHCNPLL